MMFGHQKTRFEFARDRFDICVRGPGAIVISVSRTSRTLSCYTGRPDGLQGARQAGEKLPLASCSVSRLSSQR